MPVPGGEAVFSFDHDAAAGFGNAKAAFVGFGKYGLFRHDFPEAGLINELAPG
jgi:hypothetical protein